MVFVAMLALLIFARFWGWFDPTDVHDMRAAPQPVAARGDLAEDEKATIELFRQHSPAVVFITTAQIGIDTRYFDERMLSQGAGSGFVWSEDGYIVTNDHVIASASIAQVTLSDQSVWEAKLVGRAPGTDLAVLKINAPADRLQKILIGQSSNLQVGQKVFAIGNPFGLDQSLTTGIISALDREISASEQAATVEAQRKIHGVIQTDAAINPGNSGGPLLDSAGLLIGVNTAIYSPSGAYAGIGFAIPVDTVNRVVPQLIQHGRLMRPTIGIVPFSDQMTRQLGLQGVLIREIERGSPAETAELQPTQILQYQRGFTRVIRRHFGDLIIQADRTPIENLDDWFTFLEQHKNGDGVTLTVVRGLQTNDQQKVEVNVNLVDPDA